MRLSFDLGVRISLDTLTRLEHGLNFGSRLGSWYPWLYPMVMNLPWTIPLPRRSLLLYSECKTGSLVHVEFQFLSRARLSSWDMVHFHQAKTLLILQSPSLGITTSSKLSPILLNRPGHTLSYAHCTEAYISYITSHWVTTLVSTPGCFPILPPLPDWISLQNDYALFVTASLAHSTMSAS